MGTSGQSDGKTKRNGIRKWAIISSTTAVLLVVLLIGLHSMNQAAAPDDSVVELCDSSRAEAVDTSESESTSAVEGQNTVDSITTQQFLEDYDTLWRSLEENYVFFPMLEKQGIDVSATKTETRKLIQNQPADVSLFYETLDKMFLRMNYFAHLSVETKDGYDVDASHYCAKDAGENAWKNALEKAPVRKFYSDLPTGASGSTAPNAASSETISASYDQQRKVAIISIRSFNSAYLDHDQQYILDFLLSLQDQEVSDIVFDLSHNRGGTTEYWQNNIVAPFGGSYTWDKGLYVRATELIKSYLPNLSDYQPISALPENHTAPEFVSTLGLTHYYHSVESIHSDATLPENLLAARRWVLIDDAVYSAADSFAYFCKTTKWATLVGAATDGDGLGMTPIPIDLPNTGILVRFSSQVGENTDGTCNTESGTSPDYYCNRFESPLSTFYRITSQNP